jgi:thiamine-phosphate pyrophosphorylase
VRVQKNSITDCRLYGFIDIAYLEKRKPATITRQLIAGGVDVIQVRAKKLSNSKRLDIAKEVVKAAADSPVPIIINDDIEAAIKSGADGIHLGQEDWAAIPHDKRLSKLISLPILGISTHSLRQARHAEADGANYIGVGPVFATGTKPDVAPVTPELVRQVAGQIRIPFFAIGGITLDNLALVMSAGATRVAVVSAILKAPDITKAATEFKKRLA